MSTYCGRCNRSLSNPHSQEVGLGPVCAALRDAAVEQEEKTVATPPQSWPDFDYKKAAENLSAKNDEGDYMAYRLEGDHSVVAFFQTGEEERSSLPHVMYHSPTGKERLSISLSTIRGWVVKNIGEIVP